MLHATMWVLGAAGVVVGFVFSVMYLIQHRRLRQKADLHDGLELPSLERLGRLNWWSIIISVPLLTIGMATGVGLSLMANDQVAPVPLTQPNILISALVWVGMMALFVWLLAARRTPGRLVAWRTLWAAGFLLVTLIVLQVVSRGGVHGIAVRSEGSDDLCCGSRLTSSICHHPSPFRELTTPDRYPASRIPHPASRVPCMNLQVVYCTHQTADLSVREKLAFAGEEDLLRAYDELRQRFPTSEHVVVSTCNRVELYTAQEDPSDAPSSGQLARFLADFHHVGEEEVFNELLEQTGAEAVRHLFEVASSIDSMVLGENQIVSQVKAAYELATRGNANGPLTNALFQRALTVSRRVRTETQLSEGRISVASVAVGEFGRSIFDRFDDKTVLVIGAGEMAEETLRYLHDEGVGRTVVVNRSPERAARLAAEFGGESHPYEELDAWLARADVIVSTTGADQSIVGVERFRKIREAGDGRPVFILDLGAPRDFHPDVSDVDDGVFLYDIDDLERTCQRNRAARTKEIAKAQAIVDGGDGPLHARRLSQGDRADRQAIAGTLARRLPAGTGTAVSQNAPLDRQRSRRRRTQRRAHRQQAAASAARNLTRRSPRRHAGRPARRHPTVVPFALNWKSVDFLSSVRYDPPTRWETAARRHVDGTDRTQVPLRLMFVVPNGGLTMTRWRIPLIVVGVAAAAGSIGRWIGPTQPQTFAQESRQRAAPSPDESAEADRGWMGLMVEEAAGDGLRVKDVFPGGPAAFAQTSSRRRDPQGGGSERSKLKANLRPPLSGSLRERKSSSSCRGAGTNCRCTLMSAAWATSTHDTPRKCGAAIRVIRTTPNSTASARRTSRWSWLAGCLSSTNG